MQLRPEAVEKSLLACISKRIGSWIRTHGQVQTDGGAPRPSIADGDLIQVAAFEPEQLLMGRAGGDADGAEAEPRSDPSRSDVPAEPLEGLACSPTATICRALAGAHRR